MQKAATVLCILDGLGLNPDKHGNAVALACKPNLDSLMAAFPSSTLITFGERVGLPEGQMGNSEVGHLNIGAGRVVEQWLLRIGRALQGDFLEKSAAFQNFNRNTTQAAALHLVGLFSDGGVHSHSDHLQLLIKKLAALTKAPIWLHLITDGRDTSPSRARDQVGELLLLLEKFPQVRIKSVCGRFFSMDRDKRWERTKKGYDAVFAGRGTGITDPVAYISDSYRREISDEFIEPAVLDTTPFGASDGVIFFNFRADRMRQIVTAACSSDFNGFERAIPVLNPARVLCFTEYDHTFKLPFLFDHVRIRNHIGNVVSAAGLKQLRVAETEKYPHVTYFFNGGVEEPVPGEERTIVPSPREVKTYDQKPEMSAAGVCEVVVKAIASHSADFIVVNFANCDMVGHTGVIEAAVRAVETVDACLGRIMGELEKQGGQMLVIADHGNAEYMLNPDGTSNTAHTKFPVPVILFSNRNAITLRGDGALCDVAPTLIKMMDLSQPSEMTGRALY